MKFPIVQSDEYYPFGLTFNGYSRENSKRNDYLYNGKEKQDELGLEWLDYGAIFDKTDQGPTYYSTRLNGSINSSMEERYGVSKSLSVMPGDTVRAEVYVKYADPAQSPDWDQTLKDLLTSIANNTAPQGTFIDGGSPGSIGGQAFPLAGFLNKSPEADAAPKAFLNWLLFDRDYKFLDGGYIQITEAAREDGSQTQPYELLQKEIIISQAGFVYLYLSNDNVALGGSSVDVFFDDFKVEHVKGAIVQTDDYYPFGLTFNEFQRENSTAQNFGFNGIENADDLGLNVNTSAYRVHDPALGRWWQIDPKPHESYSLYSAMGNNPILYSDPWGDTTSVYSMTGTLLHTINDDHQNQSHFIDEGKFSGMKQGEDESDGDYSKRVRSASAAFIGENTMRDMELIAGVSNALSLEFGFVGTIGRDREIRLTMLDRDGTNTIQGVQVGEQIDRKYTPEEQEKLFLFGHTHPDKGFDVATRGGSFLMTRAERESRTMDPTGSGSSRGIDGQIGDFRPRLRDRTNGHRRTAAFLLTSAGFAVYTTVPYNWGDDPSGVSKARYDWFKKK